MYENKEPVGGLTSLEIQVDSDGQVHSFTDNKATWKFVNPITVIDLVEKYRDISEERTDELTSLEIQVDSDGQVHSFTNYKATWKFMNPIPVIDLVEKYKDFLDNVVMEPKVIKKEAFEKHSSKKSSFDRVFNRR